jgi:molybdopterin converting factor small subunit
MDIQVKVATILLRKAGPPLERSSFGLEVPVGMDVEGLVASLGIPGGLVGSVTVNNHRSPLERMLAPGDTVVIIPAISGG